jgi:hypothetical protein
MKSQIKTLIPPKKKTEKEIGNLNTINQLNLTDISITFQPTLAEQTFFSSTCRNSMYHMLGNKTILNKFIQIKIYNGFSPTTMESK